MNCRSFIGPSEALYRAISQIWRSTRLNQELLQTSRSDYTAAGRVSPILPSRTPQKRSYASAYRSVTREKTIDEQINQSSVPQDEKIQAEHIYVVQSDGRLSGLQSRHQTLNELQRGQQLLRQVGKTADDIPVCKIFERHQIVEQIRQQQELKKRKTADDTAKQIELNWAMTGNDLGHRMDKLIEFLKEGRRVSILIARKKRGRRADVNEIENILARIRETVQTVEGAEEYSNMQGTPGVQAELFFQGPAGGVADDEAKSEKEERVDKKRKKQEEKEQRRAKQEARARKKKEEEEKLGIAIEQ